MNFFKILKILIMETEFYISNIWVTFKEEIKVEKRLNFRQDQHIFCLDFIFFFQHISTYTCKEGVRKRKYFFSKGFFSQILNIDGEHEILHQVFYEGFFSLLVREKFP